MEFARGASERTETTRVDDGYRLPDHPPPHGDVVDSYLLVYLFWIVANPPLASFRRFDDHTALSGQYSMRWRETNGRGFGIAAQMMVDALRLELLKESIRQELIVAELAGQPELGPEVLGELRMGNAGPLCPGGGPGGLQLTTLPHRDTSPDRQDDQLHNIPLLPKLQSEEALMTRRGALMLRRRPAKERIEKWYQPPWRRSVDEDDASLIWTRQSKKTFSGIKRKRTTESSAPNKKRSYGQWACALCHVNTSSELCFKEHCAGQRHLSNVVDLEWTKGMVGLKKIATAETHHGMQHHPWNCSICQVKCSGELDLKNHLNGRRHLENIEALCQERKKIEGNSGVHEAKSYENKVPQLVDKNQRLASRWNCSICKANCTSEFDLDSHLRGRRHQQNLEAQFVEDNNTAMALLVGGRNSKRLQYSVHKTN
ncbi:hypothetical protein EJB05_48873, partial [Eragrostis curvula]